MLYLEGRGALEEESVGLYWLHKAAAQKHKKAIIRHAVVIACARLRAKAEQVISEAPEADAI